MVTIYGIKNCDTMKTAISWLKEKNVPYTFHDYKTSGIDEATLKVWLQHFPSSRLVNSTGTTYRKLTDEEKAGSQTKPGAIALMMKYTSVIKRPVWDLGDGSFFLGWDESELTKLLGTL